MKCPACHRSFPRGSLALINYLTIHNEIEQYKVAKAINLSYRTVLRLLHSFAESGWIELIRTEKSSKGGKDKNIWRLAKKGHLFFNQIRNQNIPKRITNQYENDHSLVSSSRTV
jgi:DNA-binding PadR family transcriptional regulator